VNESLPQFRYHRDPIATGSVVPSAEVTRRTPGFTRFPSGRPNTRLNLGAVNTLSLRRSFRASR